jgi:hypothetical protein
MPATKAQKPDRKPGPVLPLPIFFAIINSVPSPAGDDLAVQFNGDGEPLTVVPFDAGSLTQHVSHVHCGVTVWCIPRLALNLQVIRPGPFPVDWWHRNGKRWNSASFAVIVQIESESVRLCELIRSPSQLKIPS